MKNLFQIPILLTLLALTAPEASGAIKTWNGSVNGSWQIASNWIPAGVPVNGDALVFPVTATKLLTTNGAGGPVNFASLSIAGNGYELRSSDMLVITNGLTNSGPALSENTIFAGVRPGENSAWNISTRTTLRLAGLLAISSVTLTGNVGGAFIVDGNVAGNFTSAFEKNGAGVMQINSTATLSNVNVNTGTLTVNASLNSALRVGAGTTLNGGGTVSDFACAGTVSPGGGSPGRLTIAGAAPRFEPGSTLSFALNGAAPGVGHDQLLVSAPFDLSGTALALTGGFTPTGGTALVIITNMGVAPFTSAFAGLPEGSFVTVGPSLLRITYAGGNGNDVALIAPSVWDGGAAGDQWTSALNWVQDAVPVAGSDLVFPRPLASTLAVNSFAAGTAFRSIRLDAGYELRGTGVLLSHGIEASGTNTVIESAVIELPVTLTAPQTFRAREMVLNLRGLIQNGGHALTVDTGRDVVIEGDLAGTGGLIKTGADDLALVGPKTFSGPFKVEQGIVRVFHAQAFGTPAGTTTVRADASLDLSEPIGTISEPLSISGGLAAAGAHTNRWSGAVTLPDVNVPVALFSGAGLEFSGTVSGPGGFTLHGGTLGLLGTANYNGSTTNDAGTLVVNGALANSDVFGTGRIEGAGQVRGLFGPFIVSPGAGANSTGVLTASGALDLTGGAVELNIQGATPGLLHDQLDLGAGAFGSPELVLRSEPGLPLGLTVSVIRVGGVVPVGAQVRSGGALLAEGAEIQNNGNRFRLSYAGGDGNDITLTTVLPISGVTRVWDGGGADDRWTTAANWAGDSAPLPGDRLRFPAGAARRTNQNDFAAGTVFDTIEITGQGYVLSGQRVTLISGLRVASAIDETVDCSLPLTLVASCTVTNLGPSILDLLGAIDLGTNTLTIGCPANVLIRVQGGSPISGAGGVKKSGAGEVAFFRANSFGGPLVVEQGRLTGAGTVLGSINGGTTVLPGARLEIFDTNTIREALTLGGTLHIVSATNRWAGPITITGTNASITAVSSLLVSGAITGAETNSTLTVGPIGRVYLTGFNDYFRTIVQGAVLVVNGAQSANEVVLTGSGMLAGTGSVGPVRSTDTTGIISPDSSFGNRGILSTRGLEWTTATTYTVDLEGPGPGIGHDGLDVLGPVNLGGATLTLNIEFSSPFSDEFVLINNAGPAPVAGAFDGLSEGALITSTNGTKFRLTYTGGDGNDVVLAMLPGEIRTDGIVGLPGGAKQISGQAFSFSILILESTTELRTPSAATVWQPILTNSLSADGRYVFIDTQATNFPIRFYRVRLSDAE